MSSSAVIQLVSFLTRPLMRSHTPATIVSLQFSLHTTFSTLPSESSLLLSAQCPPPPAIQRACIVSGVRWAEWIRLLCNGVDLKIFLTKTTLAVKLGTMPRRTIWIAPAYAPPPARFPHSSPFRTTALVPVPTGVPMAARMHAALASARTRRGTALNPTRIPTLLSSSYTAADLASENSDSDSDVDESDCESDSGSSFTSVSSTSSTSRFHARASSRANKPDVARYRYPGGVTQVASGCVMLGVVPQPQRTGVAFGWRRSAIVPNAVRKVAACAAPSWRRSA